jgi:hypothetical protein
VKYGIFCVVSLVLTASEAGLSLLVEDTARAEAAQQNGD